MPTAVTVLDGGQVVGGTKILIETGGSKILCDFGTNYTVWNKYFEEYLKPRASYGLVDVVSLGLLPPLPAIYRTDFVPKAVPVNWKYGVPQVWKNMTVDGVVASHAHLDHCGYISFLKHDVPIFSGLTTALFMKAIQDLSRTQLEGDICYVVPREDKNDLVEAMNWKNNPALQRQFYVPNGTNVSAEAAHFWAQSLGGRGMIPQVMRQADAVGKVPLRLFPVDHSIPGSTAIAFETEAGWIVYTGDIRRHGAGAQATEEFMHKAARLQPILLLSEGTKAQREEEIAFTEADVAAKLLAVVEETDGLVVADFGSRNLERLLTFRNVAETCRRHLVLMAKDVHLMRAAHLADGATPDPLKDPIIKVYQEAKVRESAATRFIYQQFQNKLISAGDAAKAQGEWIMCFSYWDINELIEIQPGPNSIYIYSSSEAYDEEQRADMRRLRAWLKHFEMKSVGIPDPDTGKPLKDELGFHASGHAPAGHLGEIVEAIAPKVLMPVHTENPQWFVDRFANRFKVAIPKELEPVRF